MTKQEQINHNIIALGIFDIAMLEFDAFGHDYKTHPLRKCSALVIETENYYLLRSYSTYVAAIEKKSHICVDVLRHEYKFTRTSVQHISKFIHDYTPYPWNNPRYTWRKV